MNKIPVAKKATLILLGSFMFFFAIQKVAYAQEKTVPLVNATLRGLVRDATSHLPISGVTIKLDGVTHSVTTDKNGEFQFITGQKLPFTLLLSYIGYDNLKITADTEYVSLEMTPALKVLDDVVIVGYGTQKKNNLTGAVASLDQKQLKNRPITNATQALQNIPGVYTNQNKGRPGADEANIQIRGTGTLNNSNPLVLVDGVEYPLSYVNPNDIESISVLKDAASAAIYGNRAANGVILIKTKSGIKGKYSVDYTNYFGVQRGTQFPNVVSNTARFMEAKNTALKNEGKPIEFTDEIIQKFKTGGDDIIYPNTNWFDIMFHNAPIQEHNVRIAGGNDRTTFSLSLGYLDQKGILIETFAKRYSINANIQSEISDKFKIGANILGNFNQNRESAYTADEGNGEGGILGLTYRGLPFQTPYAQDGTYADQWIRVPGHNFFRNTVALSKEGFRKNRKLNSLANVYGEYKLPLDIRYKITLAVNSNNANEKFSYPQIYLTNPLTQQVNPIGNTPTRGIRQIHADGLNFTNYHTLNWDKKIRQHQIGFLAGYSIERFDNEEFSAYNEGYLGNDLTELNAGSTAAKVGGTSSSTRLLSYFGRVNYNFKEKYLFEANYRYDGSSKFARNHRWGFFPAFSAGWRLSEEEFMKDITAVSNLKIRGSYGKLGNQAIPAFSYIDAINLGQNYSFNGTLVGGAAITQLSDPNITWETTSILDFGLDASFLKNSLSLEFDYFNKKTSDILRQVSIPGQIGNLKGPYKNIGSVGNKGLELTMGYKNSIQEVNFGLTGTITYIKNKVLSLNSETYYGNNTIIKEGASINSFYGLVAEGIFQSTEEIKEHASQSAGTVPGDIKYKDLDGNNIIDNNDRTVIGNSIPKINYGFSFNVAYRNFDFSAIFQGVGKVNTYLTGNLAEPLKNGAGITEEWINNSWTPENPGASLPRLTTSTGYPPNFQTSNFWLRDASYLRLKNIQLSYNFPVKLIQPIGLSKLAIFVNAQNYLTFSKFKFSDPERNLTTAGIIEYPNAKSITAGLNISF